MNDSSSLASVIFKVVPEVIYANGSSHSFVRDLLLESWEFKFQNTVLKRRIVCVFSAYLSSILQFL